MGWKIDDSRCIFKGMGGAHEGFVVLVHIPVGGGLLPYRDVYLLAPQPMRKLKPALKTFNLQSQI
jgi:hypothetical protein